MPTTSVRSAWEGGNLQFKTVAGGYAAGIVAVSGAVAVAADVLAIPLTHRVVEKTSGADAEACTLADGEPGQELTIILVVDGGGTPTVTPATATGWATLVLADAGDQAHLRYVDDTVGWVIIGATGVAAPPAITV
jgi:hypothetical protein